MKTGQPKQRLSEKLNADLEQMRNENAALMEAQLQSFRNDLKTIAESGLAIIKTDTETYLLRVRKHLMRRSANTEKTASMPLVWMALIAFCLGMSATITVFAMKSWFEPKMHTLGITAMERPDATYLMATGDRTTLQLCTLAGQQVDCLRIEKE
jgi:hypothetical protein